MSRKTSDVFRTTFLTMDGTFDPNNSQLFFRPLQAPLNTTDNSYYSLGAAQSNDPSLRINKYDGSGQFERFGYLYDTQFNIPPPGKFIIVAGGAAPNTLVYSQDRVYWSTSPNGASYLTTSCLAVAYDGFTWVAGGIGTRNVVYSSNGQNWLDISGASNILIGRCSAIATNGDVWIAGGRGSVNCAICFSYDLITWYNTSANILNIFAQGTVACIAYNGSIWLAGGSYVTGTMFFPLALSTDGIYWTGLSVTTALLDECYSLCWNGSLWFAGGNYSGSARILYSIDGNKWNVATLNGAITTSVRAIAWNGTLLVAGGYDATNNANTLAYSYDGIIWYPAMSPVFPSLCDGIMWDGITWQAVGQGGIATSPDGLTWTINTQGSTVLPTGYAIAVNKILPLVAPGEPLPSATSPLTLVGGRDTITGCTIAYSTDGITWKSSQQVATVFGDATVNALCWNGRLWVGGFSTRGSPGLYPTVGYSYDGITWNSSSSGSTIVPGQVKAVAWGIDKFIAFGDDGMGSVYLIQSTNGIDWTTIATAPPDLSTTRGQIQYNGSIWIITNFDYLYYSYDGITWVISASGSAIFSTVSNALAWNGRLWVAGGIGGSGNVVAYSPDGVNWTQGTLTYEPGFLYSMAWNGSLFVCGNSDNGDTCIGYSYDGITWYPAEYIPISPIPRITSVTWTGTLWVATGLIVSTRLGVVLYSYNGTVWHDSTNGSLVVTDGGIVIAANRVNPYNGNTLPPPVLNQGITVPNGYGIFTSNANNLYKSSVLYLDETNGRIGINQTTRTYTDVNGDPISAALEISGGGITVTTTSAIPGLYLMSSNSTGSGSGGRIELNDTLNGFGWRIDNNANNFNHLEITAFVVGSDPLQVMDMRPDTGTIGIGGANDNTYRLKVYGDVNVTGTFSISGTKSFLIDHPNPALSDTHYLRYCCVEGPTRGDNLYRWTLTTTDKTCSQSLPSYSPYLNENWQFFVSAKDSFGTGYVILLEDETSFTLHVSEEGTYNVIGVATRKDKGALSFDEKGVEFLKE